MEFKATTFEIAKDIELTAEVAYYQGNPICKLKTVVLRYCGEVYDTIDGKSTFSKLLIMNITDSIYVVELINYLSRCSNGFNLFDVYAVDVADKEAKDLHRYTFGNMTDVIDPRARENQNIEDFDTALAKRYNECYDTSRRKFTKSALVEHMNPKFKYVNTNFDFDYIPIYGYVNASGVVSKTAEPYVHLAVVFNILAHQDRFALINNQEAISSFNTIMEAEELKISAEDLNLAALKRMTEKKRFYKQKLNEEKAAHEETKRMRDEIMERFDKSEKQNAMLIEIVKDKDGKIDELKSLLLQEHGTLLETQQDVKDILRISNAQSRDMYKVKSKMNDLATVVNGLNASNYCGSKETVFMFWLYLSEEKPSPNYTKEIPKNTIWLYSQIREDTNTDLPSDADVVFKANIVSRAIYNELMSDTKDLVKDTYYRNILIDITVAHEFVERLHNLMIAKGIHPETYNIKILDDEIETMKEKQRILDEREEIERHEIEIRQQIIDSRNCYIYFMNRYRKLYNVIDGELVDTLDATLPFFVRIGAGGRNIEKMKITTLEHSSYNDSGDRRIKYE